MFDLNFDKDRFKCRLDDYCTGDAIDLADPSLHARTQEYKRKLSGRMKPLSGQDLHRIPESKGYYVTKKYDGEFALIFFDGNKLISVNPGGTVRAGLPCFDEAEKLLKAAKVRSCILACEIYMKESPSKALAIQQVVKVLRGAKTRAELERLGLAVFDIIEKDGKTLSTTKKIFDQLTKWFGKGKLVQPVEYVVTDEVETITQKLQEWVVEQGAEGIVLRHDQAGWYKIKLWHNLDAAVIGFSVGSEDHRKDMLHDLLVAVMRADGTFQELTRVGGGFTDEDRKSIAKEMKRRIVPSDYVAVNNDYVAYEMIAPGPVIELSYLDLIAESARGGPVNRMVLEYDGKRYSALTRMPLVSVISPQFVRMRDDKGADVDDVSIRQVSEMVPVKSVERSAQETQSKPSEILERTVYTKTMRDNLMVRKLLLWKTNKGDQPDFPGFVVYLTDFSPNRKDPLEREVRVAETESAAREHFKMLAEKNFVGGWEKVA